VLRLLHTVVEGDSDHRAEFCKWLQTKTDKDVQSDDMTVQSDEAMFKLSGTVK
jgi:rubrerythrin